MTHQERVAKRGRCFASADKPLEQGEQLPAAGKGPAKGMQEVPAAGEIMGSSSHPCPTKSCLLPELSIPPCTIPTLPGMRTWSSTWSCWLCPEAAQMML